MAGLIAVFFIGTIVPTVQAQDTPISLSPSAGNNTSGGNIIQLKATLSSGPKITFIITKKDGNSFNDPGTMTIRAGAYKGCVANNDSYHWSYSSGLSEVKKTFDLRDYDELGSSKDWYAAIGRPSVYCDGTPPSFYSGKLHFEVPKLKTPSSLSRNDTEFDWGNVDGANTYRIVLSKDSHLNGFNDTETDTSDCTNSSVCQNWKINCSLNGYCSSNESEYDGFVLETDTRYCWSVRAGVLDKSEILLAPHSNWASGSCFTVEAVGPGIQAPNNVQATDGDYENYVKITWDAVSNADSYEIWRGTSNSNMEKIDVDSKSPFKDENAEEGVKYYYAVKAVKGSEKSNLSTSDKGYLKDSVVICTGKDCEKPDYIVTAMELSPDQSEFEVGEDFRIFGKTKNIGDKQGGKLVLYWRTS